MTEPLSSAKIPSVAIDVSSSKLFTYPTRLANCWAPSVQEIILPRYTVSRPAIDVTVLTGSTQLLGIRHTQPIKHVVKSLIKRYLAPVRMENHFIYDARYEIDGNLAHVMDNIVSAVLALRQTLPNITVIMRAKASNMARNILDLLKIPTLCTDANVIGKLILLKEPHRDWFTGETGMYSFLFDNLHFNGYTTITPKRLFISRRGTRCLLNESEIDEILRCYGFQKVFFEDISLAEQWSLARNAEAVVALHGAALFNLVFNRRAVKLIELFHPGYFVHGYRQMVNAIGGSWCGVTGQFPPDIIRQLDYLKKPRHFALESTRIDTVALKRALDYLDLT